MPDENHRRQSRRGRLFGPARGSLEPNVYRAKLQEKRVQKHEGEYRWTGDVQKFLSDRRVGLVDESGSQLPLSVSMLQSHITKDSLTLIHMRKVVCPESECPKIVGCPQIFSPHLGACTNTLLSSAADSFKFPENCIRENMSDHNSMCTKKGGSFLHVEYSARVWVLKDVYVSWAGHAFNDRYQYYQAGCFLNAPVSSTRQFPP